MLRTYSTCSYPGYQDTTTYAALSKEDLAVLLEVVWWHHEGNVGAKCAEEGRRHAWCHHPGATVVPGAIIVVIGINTQDKSGLLPLG